ncbi:MAG: PVC-type heme-binding CxxCH protein [Planctomycetaceae bacterium]
MKLSLPCRSVLKPTQLISSIAITVLLFAIPPQAKAQRDLTDIPEPDPKAELAAMTPDPAARVNLFASDPDIRKPIQINFDARGRLWVASSEVYPQIKPGERANDKIIVLEDTDHDGISDRSTVFAEELLIPTGVVPDGTGGAYVASSTELLHFADTDGDGKADRRRVVMSGFGTEDTHHLLHTLRWGPDGCLYFNQSIYIHSHIETAYGTKHLEGGGIWRYRPETGELSVFCKGFVNPWGHAFDAKGESFVTDGAYFEGINYAFPGAVFVTSPGETRFVPGMNPGSPKHCGLEVLSGTHIPPSWSGDLVTSDFRGHRVCRFTLSPNQSTFLSRQQPEILTTDHVAFRPIDARMGPDGTLFVADWYNPIIQHGEVDFRDERRDRKHGRIWRVSFEGRPLDHWPDFQAASRDELIELLEAPSLAVRQFAREHLWPMVRTDADGVLAAIARWRDSAGSESLRLSRALEQQWLGEVAGRFEQDAFELIASAEPSNVSRPSLRSASRMAAKSKEPAKIEQRAMELIRGEHGPSRFESIVVLGQSQDIQAAVQLVRTAQTLHAPIEADPILDFALWQSLRNTRAQWTAALREGQLPWQEMADGLAYAVTSAATPDAAVALLDLLVTAKPNEAQRLAFAGAIAHSGDAETLGKLLQMIVGDSSEVATKEAAVVLSALVARTQKDRTIPANADQTLASRFAGDGSLPSQIEAAQGVITAAGQWKANSMIPVLIRELNRSDRTELRAAVLRSLGAFDDPAAKAVLLEWAKTDRGADSAAAIESIAAKQPQQAAKLASAWIAGSADEVGAGKLLASLAANKAVAKALPELLAKQMLPVDRARALLASVRKQGGNAEIEAALRAAGKLEEAGWKLTPELSNEILSALNTGDAAAGEAIYRRVGLQCVQCHAIGPAGGVVGPNLISTGGSSQPDYILESLLDPNAKLKEGYSTVAVLTDDGRVTSGIPIGREAETLKLRLADGKEVSIPTDAIESEQPGKSLMPAGLLDTLTKKELIDLTAFLASLGRVESFTVSTKPLVRAYETLVFTPEANSRINRTSIDTAATGDPALTWRPITSRVDGTLPLDELDRIQPHRETPAASYIRFDVVVGEGQSAKLKMPTKGIYTWLNGRPTPAEELASRSLATGTYRVVVGIVRDEFQGDWSVLVE